MLDCVGVDLAWGSRASSGLAVIDAGGEVATIASAVTDDEIIDHLRPWAQRPCLVAFDAPLVVVNPSGSRPCERQINHYFGRFQAGCHPSSLGRPGFADGGRARRLAIRLGLAVDPASGSTRRAIEVYPHPATVMLFGLKTILKYKSRTGRSLSSLRTELLKLVSYLENGTDIALAGSAHWRALRDEVNHATTKAQLKRAEDRVDAVLCAYIARHAQARPGSVRTLGDARTGYIVTPVTPEMARLIDRDRGRGPGLTVPERPSLP